MTYCSGTPCEKFIDGFCTDLTPPEVGCVGKENCKTFDIVYIDLEKEFWNSIVQAASESDWIPEEYYMNDWVSDVCAFLRHRK